MKYKKLHHQAKHIDRLIDYNIRLRGSLFIPQEELANILLRSYSDFYLESCGWHKVVFGIRSINHRVVLKIGTKKSIENDHRAYKSVPHTVRHQLLATIFWHTKYCLLQEYGSSANVSKEQLSAIRQEVYKYGIFDIKADNLRVINGKLKIIDSNVTRIPLPTILRKIDEFKLKLPDKLDLAIRKMTKIFYEK